MQLSDQFSPDVVDQIVNNILKAYPEKHVKEWADSRRFVKYQKDPVAFGREVLRERYYGKLEELMCSVRDYPVTVSISANATGKTFIASSLALWMFFCFPGSRIITLAAPPEKNLKELLWGELNRKRWKHLHLFAGHTCNVMDFRSPIDSSMVGITIPQSGTDEEKESKVSGKHASHMLFLVDEADAVPDAIFKGIKSCLSGGMCRLLCMFNPRRMSGAVYEMIRDNRANVVHLSAFDHPNVITGEDMIPGAVSREITVRRINEYTMRVHDDDVDKDDSYFFQVPEFLVGAVAENERGVPYPPLPEGWRKITDHVFTYQTLGQYPKGGDNQLIQKDWVDAARVRWDMWVAQYGENPPEGVRPIIGLDIADMGADLNCLCPRYGNWVARLKTWKGVEPNETADIAANIALNLKSADVKTDGIGVGADVAPLIKKQGVKATAVVVSEKPTQKHKKDKDKILKFNRLRDELMWEMREWFEGGEAMIPPDPDLMDELLALTYDDSLGPIRVISRDKIKSLIGRSPDKMSSLMLTFAKKNRVPRVWRID